MSDRVATLDLLTAYLKTKNCTAVIASHEAPASFHAEHDPFAGKSRIMIYGSVDTRIPQGTIDFPSFCVADFFPRA
jgi:hypothetical protein